MNLFAGQFVATFGSADRYLARIAAARGDDREADARFEAASAMDEAMGSAVHVAETMAYQAVHRINGGRVTDGHELARRARALAEPVGQRRVLRILARAAGPEAPDGLTERELEVLKLLAAGLSNREIGERLYISGNTAANHVRSILIKTGATNRTQAAMYAATHELA